MLVFTAQLYWFSPIRTAESLGSFNALTGIGFGGGFILYAVGAALFMAQQVRLPAVQCIWLLTGSMLS